MTPKEKKHRLKNKEHYKEYKRAWYAKNKERVDILRKQWCKDNKERYHLAIKNSKTRKKAKWLEFIQKYVDLTCFRCGYNKWKAAIEFHHRDPKDKLFEITEVLHQGWGMSSENMLKLKQELEKVDVVCANCHREIHEESKVKENI